MVYFRKNDKTMKYIKYILPETRTGMNNPMSCCFLPHPFLNQSLLRPKKLHRQLIIGWLKNVLKLISNPSWFIGRFIEFLNDFT